MTISVTTDCPLAASFVSMQTSAPIAVEAHAIEKIIAKSIKYLSPNFYAQTAIFNSVYGGDMSVAYAYIGILWGFTAAASVLAVLLSRRKRA